MTAVHFIKIMAVVRELNLVSFVLKEAFRTSSGVMSRSSNNGIRHIAEFLFLTVLPFGKCHIDQPQSYKNMG